MKYLITLSFVLFVALSPLQVQADQAPGIVDAVMVTDVVQAPDVTPMDAVVSVPDAPVPMDVVVPPLPDTTVGIPIPQTTDEAIEQAEDVLTAFQYGQYIVGILLLIGILVFAYRKFYGKK